MFFSFTEEVELTNKIVIYLKCILRCFDMCTHCERILTIELIKILITSHTHFFFSFSFFLFFGDTLNFSR